MPESPVVQVLQRAAGWQVRAWGWAALEYRSLLTRLVERVELEQSEQAANLMSGLGAVPHGHVAVDDVAAPSSDSLALQV